jgi:hypothetical protein
LSLEAVNTEPPDASYFRKIKLIRYIQGDSSAPGLLTTNIEIVKCLQAIKVMTPSAHLETLTAIPIYKKSDLQGNLSEEKIRH